ncbi:MAG: hypothetical protein LUQ65_00305 [Candidatus Helarchaeota archaeon]|nr:hypothetical protein [Candidatus Helarchaeota archaeon]
MQIESDDIQYDDSDEEENKHHSDDHNILANIDEEFVSREFDDDLGADTTDLDNTTYFESSHKLKSIKQGEW